MNKPERKVYSPLDMTTMTTDKDEVTILLAAQQADRAAFGRIVKAYQKKAYGIAYEFVGNREDPGNGSGSLR